MVAEQLRRMHKCPSFMAHIFYQVANLSEAIYAEIVHSFFEVADSLTKRQATQQLAISRAQSQDEVEMSQVARLDKVKWSSEIQFVIFNEFHSITPVFSDIKKLGAITSIFADKKSKGGTLLKPYQDMR